jgi:hypothetical protein
MPSPLERLRRRVLRALALAAALATATAHPQAPAELRVALVIGNSAYAAAPLVNPANDAQAMSATLRQMGFSVVELRDGRKAQIEAAIAQVRDTLAGRRGVGLLYYAGHGLQLDWRNYIVPVDARLASAKDVRAQAVDVQQVVDAFRSAGNRVNIVVLDACRDNPFGTGGAKGLAPMDAPPGTLLAYATAPGNVAEDGRPGSGNGLYTRFLVQELQQPSARIEDVFKRVRLQVRQGSDGRQVPWESTSLEEDFYFAAEARPARAAGDDEALSQVAAALLAEKADWDRIRHTDRPEDLYAYLRKYPDGLISEQAQFRLDQLQQVAVTAQAGPDGIRMLPAGASRYRLGDTLVLDTLDGLTGETRRSTLRVTQADADRVEFNRGAVVYDQMGSVLRNSHGTKDPGVLMSPADLAVGKRWRSAFVNTRDGQEPSTNYYEFRVVALEDVTVPAGRFRAFRIERRGQARSSTGAITVMEGSSWVDPATMILLRHDLKHTRRGKVTEQQSVQLVARRPGAGP